MSQAHPRLTSKGSITSLPRRSNKSSKAILINPLQKKEHMELNIPPPLGLDKISTEPIHIPLDLPPMPMEKIPSEQEANQLKLPSFLSPQEKPAPRIVLPRSELPPPINIPPPLSSDVKINLPPPVSILPPSIASIPPPLSAIPPPIMADGLIPPPSTTGGRSQSVSSAQDRPRSTYTQSSTQSRKVVTSTHASSPIGSLEADAKKARELFHEQTNLGKQIRETLSPEDEKKLAKMTEREAEQSWMVNDDELANSSRCYAIATLPSIVNEQSIETFLSYAQREFQAQTHKGLRLSKKPLSVDILIQFTSKKLNAPLHPIESKEEVKAAIEIFEKIQLYMGDTSKKSEKNATTNPDNILIQFITILLRYRSLGDESYCQLIKQMTNNPKPENIAKGWHIMQLLSNFILPTEKAFTFISNWLFARTTTNPTQGWYCIQSLQRMIARTVQRKQGPSMAELNAIKNGVPFLCRVSTLFGTQKAIYVDSSTTVEEVIQTFCERINFPASAIDSLCINLLRSDDSMDILLLTKGFVGDVIRIAENSQSKLCLVQHLFIDRKTPVKDPAICQLLFDQLRRDFLSGSLPCNLVQALDLAPIIMQYFLGDHDEAKEFSTEDYIPESLIQSLSPEVWIKKLKDGHCGMLGTSKEECIKHFTHRCQLLQFYGYFSADVEVINSEEWKEINTKNITLFVSEDGIECRSRDHSQILISIPMKELARWPLLGDGSQLEFFIAGRTSTIKIRATVTICMFTVRHLNGYVNAMVSRAPYALVLEDFQPELTEENFDLLTLTKGDFIHIIEHSKGNGWEFGTVDGINRGNYPLRVVKHTLQLSQSSSDVVPVTVDSGMLPLHADILPLLVSYVKRNFRTKKLENEFIVKLCKRFTYSEDPLTHSLLKMDSNENKVAVEINNCALKYIQSKKTKFAADAVAKASLPILIDEAYCQAIRNTLSNQNQDSSRSSWEWFTMLTLACNPSCPELQEIALMYLELQGIIHSDSQVVVLAKHALLQMSRRIECEPRKNLPSMKEYDSIVEGSFYQGIKVQSTSQNSGHLIDSCSSSVELVTKVGESLHLPSIEQFGLFQVREKGINFPTASSTTIADLLDVKVATLQMKFDVLVWNFRFHLELDGTLLDVLYELMRQRIIQSEISCSLNKVLDLTSFMIRSGTMEAPCKQTLHQFLPKHLIAKHPSEALVQKILDANEAVAGVALTTTDAKLAFLQNATSRNIWNWTFFPVNGKKQKYLAISTQGIASFVQDSGDMISPKQSWDWEDIATQTIQDDGTVTFKFNSGAPKPFTIPPFMVGCLREILPQYQRAPLS